MALLIIGGGIGGLATALALHRNGVAVQVYETAPTIGAVGAGLVLGANVVRELAALGLADELQAAGVPVSGLQLADETGRALLTVDSGAYVRRHFRPHANLALRHARLQAILLAQLPPEIIHTNHTLTHFTLTSGGVTAHFANGHTATGTALVAADGLHSTVRAQLLPAARPRYAGYTCWRAVVPAPAGLLPAQGPHLFAKPGGAPGASATCPWAKGRCTGFAASTHPNPPTPLSPTTARPTWPVILPTTTPPYRPC